MPSSQFNAKLANNHKHIVSTQVKHLNADKFLPRSACCIQSDHRWIRGILNESHLPHTLNTTRLFDFISLSFCLSLSVSLCWSMDLLFQDFLFIFVSCDSCIYWKQNNNELVALSLSILTNYSNLFIAPNQVKLKLIKEEKPMVISSPTNFEHTLHVHLNPKTGEFVVCFLTHFFFVFF